MSPLVSVAKDEQIFSNHVIKGLTSVIPESIITDTRRE